MPFASRRQQLRHAVRSPTARRTVSKECEAALPESATTLARCTTDYNPRQWSKDFEEWKAESCVQREGKDDWGGVAALFRDFAGWCLIHKAMPCKRSTFEWLLHQADFRLENCMVAQLILRADLEAVLSGQSYP